MHYNIETIENLTENQAKEMSLEEMKIKGHDVYLVDFGGYFKYSALVFLNGGHLYYTNQYELHFPHIEGNRDKLKERYIEILNNKLFTENELKTVNDYNDYVAKTEYVRNYYVQQKNYVTAFTIIRNEEEEKAFDKKVKEMIYNPISWCYMNKDCTDFIKHQADLLTTLELAREKAESSYEYMKKAFLYEMFNHEYGINWQADWDVLSCFGKIEYMGNKLLERDELQNYFDQLDFNEEKRKAYYDARREYWKRQEVA